MADEPEVKPETKAPPPPPDCDVTLKKGSDSQKIQKRDNS